MQEKPRHPVLRCSWTWYEVSRLCRTRTHAPTHLPSSETREKEGSLKTPNYLLNRGLHPKSIRWGLGLQSSPCPVGREDRNVLRWVRLGNKLKTAVWCQVSTPALCASSCDVTFCRMAWLKAALLSPSPECVLYSEDLSVHSLPPYHLLITTLSSHPFSHHPNLHHSPIISSITPSSHPPSYPLVLPFSCAPIILPPSHHHPILPSSHPSSRAPIILPSIIPCSHHPIISSSSHHLIILPLSHHPPILLCSRCSTTLPSSYHHPILIPSSQPLIISSME